MIVQSLSVRFSTSHIWKQRLNETVKTGYTYCQDLIALRKQPLMKSTLSFRHWPQIRGPGRRGNPHHLWPAGSHVRPRGAGRLPVGAAAGVRRPAGPQHRSHPPQQQH